MVNGQIHYARFPINLDSNGIIDGVVTTQIDAIFPDTNYDIVNTEIVPISGGSGISNAIMVVIARRIT